jgi:hypothetical protein
MPSLVETLRMVIEGDSKGAVKAVDDLEKKMGTSNTTASKWGAGLNKAANVAAVGVVALGALIGKSVSSYATFAIQVAKVNAQTGMGAEATSRFVGQLQFLHANTASAGMAMKTLEVQIAGAKDGTKASVDIFNKLGISQQQLKATSPADTIALVRDRLSQMTDKSEQQLVASKLLGRGAKDEVLWYTASADTIGKVNTQLEKNHQILSESQLKDAEKAGAAWQGLTGAFKGFEYTLAQAVLPDLTFLAKALTGLLQLLRPFAPVLVPLTFALAGFVGIVKGTTFALNTLRQGMTIWRTMIQPLIAKIIAWTTVEEGSTVAVEANTAASGANRMAMLASLGPYALVGAAAALSAMEVYKAVQAFLSMEQAINQAKVAQQQFTANAASDIANATAKYGANSQQVQSIQAVANATTNQAGVSYTSGAGSAWNPFSWFGAGGSFTANKPTVIGVGEKGTERVDITPLGKASVRSGAGHYIDLRGANFSAHSPRELADQVGDVVMGRIVGNLAASNA